MYLQKFFGIVKEAIVRSFFYTVVWLTILCFSLVLLLSMISGFSVEGTFNAIHNHPIW